MESWVSFGQFIHTCRKNQGFYLSDGCEWVPNKPMYGTNIRLRLQRYILIYRMHSIVTDKPSPIRTSSVDWTLDRANQNVNQKKFGQRINS